MKKSIQVIIFRKNKINEILLLKRVKSKGNFWQTISGRIEKKEIPLEAAKREIKEETGIKNYKKIIKLSDYKISEPNNIEYCFAFEVSPDIKINLNNNPEIKEHNNFKWLSLKKAIQISKWPQYKSQIYLLQHYLENIK